MPGPRALIIASLALLVAAAPAAALETGKPDPSRPKSVLAFWSVKATKIVLSVDFAGAAGRDCAAHGLCDTAGSATLSFPKARGLMIVAREEGEAISVGALLKTGTVSTSVSNGAATCTDTASGIGSAFSMRLGSPTFVLGTVTLGDHAQAGAGLPEPFASRCAGPALADVLTGLPSARIPGYQGMRSFKVVLDQTKSFRGEAFGGTLTATGTLQFKRTRGL